MTRMVARVLPTPVRYSAPYEYISSAVAKFEESTSGMTNTLLLKSVHRSVS